MAVLLQISVVLVLSCLGLLVAVSTAMCILRVFYCHRSLSASSSQDLLERLMDPEVEEDDDDDDDDDGHGGGGEQQGSSIFRPFRLSRSGHDDDADLDVESKKAECGSVSFWSVPRWLRSHRRVQPRVDGGRASRQEGATLHI